MKQPHDVTPYRHAFAVELRRALAARSVTGHGLAAAVGISQRQVWFWMDGRSLPFLRTATRAADALNWPRLFEIIKEARTVRCLACKRTLVTENSAALRWYCDEVCRKVATALGQTGQVASPQQVKITALQKAIGDMCDACEPSGLCNDGSCPLRGVSPLPVREGVIVAVPVPDGRKSRWDHPEQRAALSRQMKALWAGRDATKRKEKTRAANKARWAGYTPEERAALGQRISEGRRTATWHGGVATTTSGDTARSAPLPTTSEQAA